MTYKFNSLSSESLKQRKLAHGICREFARDPSKGNLKKLRQLFASCGEQVFIEYGFHCDYGNKIFMGNNVYVNTRCTFLDGGEIHLADNCLIGPGVQLITVFHDKDPQARLTRENFAKDIIIKENVWLGAGAIVLPGVTIGENTIVGAGSIVTKSLDANSTYVGNPARKIEQ